MSRSETYMLSTLSTSTSGSGLAVSTHFARLGANAIVVGRTESSMAVAAEAIERSGPCGSERTARQTFHGST